MVRTQVLEALLHSAKTKVCPCLKVVKYTKCYQLFTEHLEITNPLSTPLHKDDTVVVALFKANKNY